MQSRPHFPQGKLEGSSKISEFSILQADDRLVGTKSDENINSCEIFNSSKVCACVGSHHKCVPTNLLTTEPTSQHSTTWPVEYHRIRIFCMQTINYAHNSTYTIILILTLIIAGYIICQSSH